MVAQTRLTECIHNFLNLLEAQLEAQQRMKSPKMTLLLTISECMKEPTNLGPQNQHGRDSSQLLAPRASLFAKHACWNELMTVVGLGGSSARDCMMHLLTIQATCGVPQSHQAIPNASEGLAAFLPPCSCAQ